MRYYTTLEVSKSAVESAEYLLAHAEGDFEIQVATKNLKKAKREYNRELKQPATPSSVFGAKD